jgi:hypothetical protein
MAVPGGLRAAEPTHGPGGGGMPTPFGDSNIRVELADGELYTLDGRVVLVQTQLGAIAAYFEVDLNKQDWLANQTRRQEPYYLLQGKLSFWRQLNQQNIELTATAQVRILPDEHGVPQQVISLVPLMVVRQ